MSCKWLQHLKASDPVTRFIFFNHRPPEEREECDHSAIKAAITYIWGDMCIWSTATSFVLCQLWQKLAPLWSVTSHSHSLLSVGSRAQHSLQEQPLGGMSFFNQVDADTCWDELHILFPFQLGWGCATLHSHPDLDGVKGWISRSKLCLFDPQRVSAVRRPLDRTCSLLHGWSRRTFCSAPSLSVDSWLTERIDNPRECTIFSFHASIYYPTWSRLRMLLNASCPYIGSSQMAVQQHHHRAADDHTLCNQEFICVRSLPVHVFSGAPLWIIMAHKRFISFSTSRMSAVSSQCICKTAGQEKYKQ